MDPKTQRENSLSFYVSTGPASTDLQNNDLLMMGANRAGSKGETTRGETTWGEMVWGRNVSTLLSHVTVKMVEYIKRHLMKMMFISFEMMVYD